MKKQKLTLTSKVLMGLLSLSDIAPPLINPYALKQLAIFGVPERNYKKTIYYLEKKGWIKFVKHKDKTFFKLTNRGQLEALLIKAYLPRPETWDGRWRIIMFDIPEDYKEKRYMLRALLKANDYIRLQGSVYINPYPLNREAIDYLKKTGLISYIRIVKVEEMDDDRDLRKQFKL